MRLLWIATKPPAPPVDGGRLVALLTIEALVRQGVDVTLVAPTLPGSTREQIEARLASICRPHLVPATPRNRLLSVLGPRPYSIERHSLRRVRTEVERLLVVERFDVVHAEQLQAFAQAEPALGAGLPVVLRAQNVESDLWRATAGRRDLLPPGAGPWFAREARRLAAYEGEVVRRATATVALTERDAERLRTLAGGSPEVVAVPPPFPSELPPGETELAGHPPLVLLGSGGWLPNREGARWFLEEVWPEVQSHSPGARLHLFAPETERPERLPSGVVPHAPLADSREAFPRGSILVVPLRIASGIRMKILEAWARGAPVVATPEAVAGLEAEDGREVRIARSPREFSEAILRTASELRGGRRQVDADVGRRSLAAAHDPARIAERLLAVYRGSTTQRIPRPSPSAPTTPRPDP